MKLVMIISLLLTALTTYSQKSRVLEEDFEEGSLKALFSRWDDIVNGEGMAFSTDVPAASPGRQSLEMSYTPGKNTGGHLYKMLPEGYDTLYARFYVKFITNYSRVHHFVKMGGYNPPTTYPQGGAGIRPKGDDSFITGIEPMGDDWRWDFYTYWMYMRGYADPRYFWGNTFHPDPPAPVKHDEWICVEFMMKMNDPVSSYNGEEAFWINGKKILDLGEGFPHGYWHWDRWIPDPDSAGFEGFRWRSTPRLKLNFFWLSYYMTDGREGEIDKVLFDDVVVSRHYIGPLPGDFKL